MENKLSKYYENYCHHYRLRRIKITAALLGVAYVGYINRKRNVKQITHKKSLILNSKLDSLDKNPVHDLDPKPILGRDSEAVIENPRVVRKKEQRERALNDYRPYGLSLVEEKRLKDGDCFYNYTRMTPSQFELLLTNVAPRLEKRSIRRPITEKDRLLITLRYLATGMTMGSLSDDLKFGKSTIHGIIKETTLAIWETLKEQYMPQPSVKDMKSSAREFFMKTRMPNCVGAIGGKRFVHKKRHSVVLLAICDANQRFTYVHVHNCDFEPFGQIFENCHFGQSLLNNDLALPAEVKLPNSDQLFPCYFVGDEKFPLLLNLMRPYDEEQLSPEEEKFNERLSSATQCIEHCLAQLANKFRIYDAVTNNNPETITSIIKSITILHNFIISTKSKDFSMDVDVANCEVVTDEISSDGYTDEGVSWRDTLKDYLSTHD